MPVDKLRSIEQFLYKEARLLDNRRYREWLELLTEDIRYWMPSRFNRMREGADEDWDIEKELDELGYFDEDKESLTVRVERLYTGLAWAEDPPSRIRHLISNVELLSEGADEVEITSNFILYRNRWQALDGDEDFFVGLREDSLRWADGGWKLAKRRIILDAVLLKASNLSMFF